MRVNINILSVVILTFLIQTCTLIKREEQIIVAKVDDKELTTDEIKKVIPAGLPREDSLVLAEDYIKKWVRQELLIKKAEESLAPVMKDVTKELMEYRNSLIIYRYKNNLMRQRMDTVVSNREMDQYFNENRKNFLLPKNIVKAVYVKVPKKAADLNTIRSFCENTTSQGIKELKDFCIQYSSGYGIYLDSWIEFDAVLNKIPIDVEDQERFLERYDLIDHSDSEFYYYVSIKDYRLKNEYAPMDYVSDHIRDLILNKRKIEFLKKLEEDIYSDGLRKHKFTIYNIENK